MKTASRIVGSAAFHAGYEAQDSPTYGAERRGAPMAAYTRVSNEPILERGAIEKPDLVVVADETLVDEPAASPLGGLRDQTTVLVNAQAECELDIREPLVRADFSAMALEATGRLSSLSTALAAAACRLIGLDRDDCLAGIDAELAGAIEDPQERARNLELARKVYALASAWDAVVWPADTKRGPWEAAKLVELELDTPSRGAPSIYAIANSPARKTGNWRQYRPVLEPGKCNRCWLCFVWCPEAAIALDDEEFPLVDYDVCKGCLLCAHECPTKAFRVEREVRA